MGITRFTAETSLYKTKGHYHAIVAGLAGGLLVLPQQRTRMRRGGGLTGYTCSTDWCECWGALDCLRLWLSGECVPGTLACGEAGCICDRPFICC
jgi:hypothetical protein